MTNQLVAMKIPRPATVPVTTPLASALLSFVAIWQAPNRDSRCGPHFGPSVARSPWPCLQKQPPLLRPPLLIAAAPGVGPSIRWGAARVARCAENPLKEAYPSSGFWPAAERSTGHVG